MNYREDIKAYIDGELSPERAEQMRAAIESDSTLRAEYEFMTSVSSQIQSSVTMPEVRGFDSAMQAIRPVRRFNWRAGLAIGSAAALLLVFAWPALFSGDESMELASSTEYGSGDSADEALSGSGFGFEEYDGDGEPAPRGPMPGARDPSSYGADRTTREDEISKSLSLGADADKASATAENWTADVAADDAGVTIKGGGRSAQRAGGAPGFGGGGAAFADATVEPAEGETRQVIKSANFELHVTNLSNAVDLTKEIVKSVSGKFASSASEKGAMESVWLTLQVPQDKFDVVLAKIRKLGDVKFEKAGSNDVTELLTDAEGRINKLKTEEKDAQGELSKNQTDTEAKNTRAQLRRVREEITTLETRNSVQMKIAKTSEISVYLVQKSK